MKVSAVQSAANRETLVAPGKYQVYECWALQSPSCWKVLILAWVWHFHLDDVVSGGAPVIDHCPPVIYAGFVSLIPVPADRIGDNA